MVDAAVAVADEVPAAAEDIVGDAEDVAVVTLVLGPVLGVGHDQRDEDVVAGSLGDPFQSLSIGFGAVVVLIVVEEVDAQEIEAQVDEVAHIALDPGIGAVLARVDPV